jgi:hypothetical protein
VKLNPPQVSREQPCRSRGRWTIHWKVRLFRRALYQKASPQLGLPATVTSHLVRRSKASPGPSFDVQKCHLRNAVRTLLLATAFKPALVLVDSIGISPAVSGCCVHCHACPRLVANSLSSTRKVRHVNTVSPPPPLPRWIETILLPPNTIARYIDHFPQGPYVYSPPLHTLCNYACIGVLQRMALDLDFYSVFPVAVEVPSVGTLLAF